jgi:uncharacterized RDD family membrane protein YckC
MAEQTPSSGTPNNYAPPKSRVADVAAGALQKAGRGQRLLAVLVDGLIYGVLMIPMFVGMWPALVASAQSGQRGGGAAAAAMLAGAGTGAIISGVLILALWIFTGYLVHKNGQTIGKKLLGIKVLRSDGSRASLGRIFWLRNVVAALPGAIPIVGGIYSLLDSLLIFRDSRQCIHDNIADTIVAQA